MQAKACAKHIRISPRKARQVVDLIRGKNIDDAYAILQFTPHKGSGIVKDVLQSAIANAEHNHEMDTDSLFVSSAFVDEGPTMKRFKPRSHGRADAIRKRTSHITIMVSER